ncbi:hypothetical protein BK796_20660 [Kosakonia pseudosacchari]|uniref:Uncharacterized protein n=1 Tax=Kosakonia pseudosacchari TaxID=1646340 RepID=A0ABX4IKQ0_9ENTR|nr:hypothetical protein [Kosakonia pseudosacchari]PDO83386.1 hypothetical protein BK796_20660 [Kosakonia pseudosacchari]
MGIYTQIEVINDIAETDLVIKNDILKNEPVELDHSRAKLNASELFYNVLNAAWSEFYRLIKSNPSQLDKNTPFNQMYIPQDIAFKKEEYLSHKPIFLSNLLRVIYEYYFWTGEKTNQPFLSHETLTELSENFKEFEPYVQFDWIRDTLPISLTQWMLESSDFIKVKTLVAEIEAQRDKLLKDISQKSGMIISEIESAETHSLQTIAKTFSDTRDDIKLAKEEAANSLAYIKSALTEISALEKRIKNLRSEYNFVGLSSGFNKIKEKKEKELQETQVNYKNLFGCVFIAPVIVALIHFLFPNIYPKDYSAIFLILPFFTIEMILIYFFRLSYLEAKSLRTQLVQIELRLSLCAFIDEYVEYRKKHNTNIDKVLDNFDSMIFSPIQTNENNIPAMFDGVEAIAGLADKVIKK